jgi:hypothetical protein
MKKYKFKHVTLNSSLNIKSENIYEATRMIIRLTKDKAYNWTLTPKKK